MKAILPSPITLTYTNVPANAEAEYSASTTYAKGDKVQIASLHRVYESLVDTNVGNYPPDNPTKWLDTEATEQYKMLDEFVNTSTARADLLHVRVQVDRIDHLLLLGVVGTSMELKLWDDTELLWSEFIDLVYTDPRLLAVEDWEGYFFGQNARLYTDIFRQLSVLAYTPTLEIIISYSGGTAKLAKVTAGRAVYIGDTQFGVEAGILDFSKKITDQWGRTYLAPGNFAKKNSLLVWVDTARLDIVYQWLAELRGIPCAWVGDEEGGTMALLVFGFWRDFGMVMEQPNQTLLRIEVEGLI